MARPAADRAWPAMGDILRLLAPYPGRAQVAARIALACTLTVLVTSMYQTPEAAISAYVIFFMNRADRTSSVLVSVAMMVLITLVIGLVMLVAIASIDVPLWRVVWMVVLSVGLLFLTSASKLRPVGAIMAMIAGYGLDVLGLAPIGELATRGLLYAWLMVAIPIGVNVVVNLLLAPSPRRLAGRRLGACLRLAAQALRAPPADPSALATSLREAVETVPEWLKLSKIEASASAADLAALGHALSSVTSILLAVELACREPAARLPAALAEPVADTLDGMARMLEDGGYPVEIAPPLPVADEIEGLAPLARVVATELQSAIVGFAEAGPAAQPAASGKAAEGAKGGGEAGGGFFLPDAFSNPGHVRYALKTTAAAMFCYFLYIQLDWTGIHTCFITCYIVSLGTTAETVEKLTLRIAGCAIGALLGTAAIVFVTPSLTSITGLMALVFAGAWASAWIAQGSPRISYAGFQVAFAFFLCVLQGPAPGFDLTIARDRTIGILLGNVAVYLVFTRIWPVSIAGAIDAALADLRRRWEGLVRAPDTASRRAQAGAALAQQDAIAQNLALAHYEPAGIRPAPAWLAARHLALARLGAMAGPLFLLAERWPGDPEAGKQLRRASDDGVFGAAEATPGVAAAPTPAADGRDAVVRASLLGLIDQRLAGIGPPAAHTTSGESSVHAPT